MNFAQLCAIQYNTTPHHTTPHNTTHPHPHTFPPFHSPSHSPSHVHLHSFVWCDADAAVRISGWSEFFPNPSTMYSKCPDPISANKIITCDSISGVTRFVGMYHIEILLFPPYHFYYRIANYMGLYSLPIEITKLPFLKLLFFSLTVHFITLIQGMFPGIILRIFPIFRKIQLLLQCYN